MMPLKKTAFDWDLYDDRGKVLNELRAKQEFVDLLLVTDDGGEEAVHFAVVSALSKEFTEYVSKEIENPEETVLTNGTQVKKALLKNVVKSSLKSIVDFSYTGCLHTTMDEVWTLIEAGERYSMEDVVDSSLTYLTRQLTIENCVRIFLLGVRHRHKLANASYAFIRTKFTEVRPLTFMFNVDLDLSAGYRQMHRFLEYRSLRAPDADH